MSERLKPPAGKGPSASPPDASRDAARSDFLTTVSHEIRTPMNGVLGLIQLLLATELNSEQREYVEMIRDSATSLLSVINDILDFSKIQAGSFELNPIEFSLREIFRRLEDLLSRRMINSGTEFVTDIAHDVPDRLVGDPDRLRQVLMNLLENAIKFTPFGGAVVVFVRKGAEAGKTVILEFAVSDTGIGVSEEQGKTIFVEFSQGDSSVTRRYGGSGLGLAICSRLVELLGGNIGFRSKVGIGSVFYFSSRFELPEEKTAAKKGICIECEGRISLRVLIAEDNAVNQALLARLLEKDGHRSVVASNGFQAVESYQKGEFDVVLMDLRMPVLDGFEAARQIREFDSAMNRHVPIIALTGRTSQEDRELSIAAGIDDFLLKPVEYADLRQKMLSLTERFGKRKCQDKLRVLIVDDEVRYLENLEREISGEGYLVQTAQNAHDALAVAMSFKPDILIVDWILKDERDGLDLIAELETNNPRLKSILITGYASAELRQRIERRANIASFLEKPFSLEQIQEALRRCATS